MLAKLPFDKITVSAIVSRCEISPNTFYYHYRDIYELLGKWIEMKRETLFTEDILGNRQDNLKLVMHEMQKNPKIIYHVFDSLSREQIEKYIFESVEGAFYDLVKSSSPTDAVSEEVLRGLSNFCCYSLLGFILKFVWGHMAADVDESVDGLDRIFRGTVEFILQKETEPKKPADSDK